LSAMCSEKTKGRVINDQDAYVSEVFKLNTDSIKRIDSTNDYIPTNGGQVGSRFNKSRSIFFRAFSLWV
jgi:hypothetical protein